MVHKVDVLIMVFMIRKTNRQTDRQTDWIRVDGWVDGWKPKLV